MSGGRPATTAAPLADGRVAIPFELVAARLREHLARGTIGRVDAVVAVARGGVVLGAMAAFALGVPLRLVRSRFRDDDHRPLQGAPAIDADVPDVRGQRVLVVDDVSVSGSTLRAAVAALGTDVEAVTLVAKGRPGAADHVLIDDVASCVAWPWFEDVAPPH